MSLALDEASRSVRAALELASRGLVDRETLTELIVLCAVAGEHLLVIGPPGTAKSEAVRRVSRVIGGRYFEYLIGRFTEPSELFGPIDLKKLRDGRMETETTGMLPEAELAFLDEVFLGSTAILNTLLTLLNERTFRRGHTQLRTPLRVCVGASNALPEDEALAAFADRFLARVFVEPVADSQLEALLEGGGSTWSSDGGAAASLDAVDRLAELAKQADLSAVRPQLAHAVRKLRSAGLSLTDRRVVKAQRLIAAAAVLGGRASPTAADLWPLVYVVPTRDGQRVARETLRPLLESADNATLPAASEDASHGPKARARRILSAGNAAFEERPAAEDAERLAAWMLKLEGVAREIDAGFAAEAMPEELSALRGRIQEAVRA